MKSWIPIICALLLVQACKKDEEADEKRLTFTNEKSQVEEQNLKAMCDAAGEIAAIEGVQDRMSRIAEIAVLTSPTTELIDGLTGLEGHERLPLLKKLVAKYEFAEVCAQGLLMFDRGAPRSAAAPPKPPPGGKGDNKALTKPNSEAGDGPANSPQGSPGGGGDKGGPNDGGDKGGPNDGGDKGGPNDGGDKGSQEGGPDGGQEGGQGWWDLPDLFGPEDETHQSQ